MSDKHKNRGNRSYALRRSRLTQAQARGIETYSLQFKIAYRPEAIDLNLAFNRCAGKILEIGTGMGEATLQLAHAQPYYDFLAVEVHTPGVGNMLNQIVSRKLRNLRIIEHDIIDILENQIHDDSLTATSIYFPDPWPKTRHHKRRLVNAHFLERLLPKLSDHAHLYLATDDSALARQMLKTCDAHSNLINLAGKGQYTPRPKWRPLTKFEQRGLHLGNTIRDLIYCKRSAK